jgi:hypothetical protein
MKKGDNGSETTEVEGKLNVLSERLIKTNVMFLIQTVLY